MPRSLLPGAVALVLVVSAGAALLVPREVPPVRPPLAQAPADLDKVLSDGRPGAGLGAAELNERIAAARALTWSNAVSPDERAQLRRRIEADRAELQRRRAEGEARMARVPASGERAQASGEPAPPSRVQAPGERAQASGDSTPPSRVQAPRVQAPGDSAQPSRVQAPGEPAPPSRVQAPKDSTQPPRGQAPAMGAPPPPPRQAGQGIKAGAPATTASFGLDRRNANDRRGGNARTDTRLVESRRGSAGWPASPPPENDWEAEPLFELPGEPPRAQGPGEPPQPSRVQAPVDLTPPSRGPAPAMGAPPPPPRQAGQGIKTAAPATTASLGLDRRNADRRSRNARPDTRLAEPRRGAAPWPASPPPEDDWEAEPLWLGLPAADAPGLPERHFDSR